MELRCDHCNNLIRGLKYSLCDSCYDAGRGEMLWSNKIKQFIEVKSAKELDIAERLYMKDKNKVISSIQDKLYDLTDEQLYYIKQIIKTKMV